MYPKKISELEDNKFPVFFCCRCRNAHVRNPLSTNVHILKVLVSRKENISRKISELENKTKSLCYFNVAAETHAYVILYQQMRTLKALVSRKENVS